MKVKHSDLAEMFQILMDELEENDCNRLHKSADGEFVFDYYDYYWEIPLGQRGDAHNKPKELHIGSIDFDLELMHKLILEEDADIGSVSAHYRWLGNILIAMADTMDYHFDRRASSMDDTRISKTTDTNIPKD